MINDENKGCGDKGLDLNSGWYWTPINHGWFLISTISGSFPSGDIPENIKITVEKQTIIKISGIDKQLVGMITAKIKTFRPPEPYKGKGIKELGQYILRKEGKKK